MTTTPTTLTNTYNKVATLLEWNKMEDGFQFFHYSVKSFKSANYNAEYEIPEYYMIEREQMIAGLKHTFDKSYSDDCSAVKIENESWGISVSFYEGTKWVSEFLFEIEN